MDEMKHSQEQNGQTPENRDGKDGAEPFVMSRRKLLRSIGMTGAALVAGSAVLPWGGSGWRGVEQDERRVNRLLYRPGKRKRSVPRGCACSGEAAVYGRRIAYAA